MLQVLLVENPPEPPPLERDGVAAPGLPPAVQYGELPGGRGFWSVADQEQWLQALQKIKPTVVLVDSDLRWQALGQVLMQARATWPAASLLLSYPGEPPPHSLAALAQGVVDGQLGSAGRRALLAGVQRRHAMTQEPPGAGGKVAVASAVLADEAQAAADAVVRQAQAAAPAAALPAALPPPAAPAPSAGPAPSLAADGAWPERSLESYRALFELAPVALFRSTPDGRILEANDALARLFGYEKGEQIRQMKASELYADIADRKRWQDTLHQVGELSGDHSLGRRRDGSVFWMESVSRLVRDQHGQPWFYQGFVHDISQRQAMEQQGTLLASLLDSTDEAICVRDLKGQIITWTLAAQRMYGYRAQDVVGRDSSQLVRPQDQQEFKDKLALVAAGHNVRNWETRRVRADGQILDLSLNLSPIRDVSGAVTAVAVVARDLTEQKRTAQALRETEVFLKIVDQAVPDLVWTCDAQWRVQYLNQRFLDYLGCDIAQFNLNGWCGVMLAEDRLALTERWLKANELGTIYDADYRLLRHDGVYRWFSTRALPLKDDQGKVLQWVGVSIDIDDHRRAQEQIHRSRELYQVTLDALPTQVAVLDENGLVLAVNQRWTGQDCGLAQGLEVGENLLEKTAQGGAPAPLQQVLEQVGQILRGVRERSYSEHYCGQGCWKGCHVKRFSLHEQARVLVVLEDITQRKQAQAQQEQLHEELVQSQKLEAVGTLAGGVAHDFNNLLTAIFGYLDVALQTLPENHPARTPLDMVEKVARQASGVSSALLSFSHKTSTEMRPLSMRQLVGDVARLLRRVLGAVIELSQEIPDDDELYVLGDGTQLQQVLMNLAVNARDAMPQGGKLHLRASRQWAAMVRGGEPDHQVVLEVVDSGTGMSRETLARLFEPFFTTKPRGQATGLGLAICHGIIAAHGGRISARSQEGAGSSFIVLLPACQAPEPSPALGQRPKQQAGRPATVIVAEDNEFVRNIMAGAVEGEGYHVVEAADGLLAMAAFQSHRQGALALVLDLDMPGKSGQDCIREIRGSGSKAPIIIVTGSSLELTLGPEDILMRKPFPMRELTRNLARMLAAGSNQS